MRRLNASLNSFQAIFAVSRNDLGKGEHPDVSLRCNLINQVLRHAGFQPFAPYQYLYFSRIARQKYGSLSCRIAASYDEDLLADYIGRLLTGGSIKYAAPQQAVFTRGLQPTPIHACG